ncbi:hypothetical protein H0H93_013964 [Arthromyces matolae]|nr:hypothetical protein H0H93_013964 [Arthromyces matolae]
MAWDYKYGVCMPCTWDGKTPPNLLTNQLLEDRQDLVPRMLGTSTALRTRSRLDSNDAILQKRVGECSAFNSPGGVTVVMPNNAAAWQNGHGEGPTAELIANDPGVRDAFQVAWDASYPSATTEQERLGRIHFLGQDHSLTYADPETLNVREVPVDTDSRLSPVVDRHNPATNAHLGIDLRNLGTFPRDWVVVANFHTHPGSIGDGLGDDPAIPSEQDNTNAWFRGVPGIIVQCGPLSRAQLSAPRGYPDTRQQAPNKEDPGRKIPGWVPSRAQFQRRATLL